MTVVNEEYVRILREHGELIRTSVLCAAKGEITQELANYLVLAESNGWEDLVAAIRAIVGGTRDRASLSGLDEEDTIVVSAILDALDEPGEIARHLLAECVQLLQSGYPALAEAKAGDAVILAPGDPQTHAHLGLALHAQRKLDEAEKAYARSLSLNPEQALVRLNFGVVLQDLKRFDEAMRMFEETLRIQPGQIDAMAHLAYLYERAFRLADAHALVQRGLAINPRHSALLFIEGKLYQREGAIQEAIAAFESALQSELPPVLVGEAHSRLGYLYDRLGDTEKAYGHFSDGNLQAEQQNRLGGVTKESYLGEIDYIAGLTEGVSGSELAGQEDAVPEGAPVFLIGFPRSGTTLLNQILDSHPNIQALEEKPAAFNVVRMFMTLTSSRARPLVDIDAAELEQLRSAYFETVDKYLQRTGDALLVDKMPLNIAYAPVIRRVFPNAKFILALRHPCDAVLSCFMHSFGANAAMANFTSLEDTVALYAKVMGRWEGFAEAYNVDFHRIRYEDLVADFAGETVRLLGFLGLDWDDAVTSHTDNARRRGVVDTPSYDQITEPLYDRAVYRWQRYAGRFSPHMARLAPFIERYGYRD